MVKKCCPPQNNYSSSFQDILNERKSREYCLKKEKNCCPPKINLLNHEVGRRENGYWFGEYTFLNENGLVETSPGITMERIGLEQVLKKLPNPVLLSEDGTDSMENANTFILGDDKDPTDEEMQILEEIPKISLGKESLLSSACVTLIHHHLDSHK